MLRIGPVLLLAVAIAPAASAQDAGANARPHSRVDSIIEFEMRARRIPGVAVAVVENGNAILKRAYGIANLETETPLRTDAVFELASVTKQFTAAAIMLLVEQGKVRLDDPIGSYLDSIPPAWSRITVRQLLTHTGGLAISAVPRPATLFIRTQQVYDFVKQQPMQFEPGQTGWYSDAGYFLLGMIIEKASGQSYRAFLQQRVFDPLGMSRTSITDRERVIKGRVATYSMRDGQLLNWRRDWDYELPSFFGIWSTLDDLVKWDAALRSEKLLETPTLAQLWTPAKLANGQYARVFERLYGFGFELSDLRGQRTAGHGGASGTYLLRFVDEPLTIIVLTNLDSQSGGRHNLLLARSIAGALRPDYRPHNLLPVQKDSAPNFTGQVQAMIADLAAGRESPLMSAAFQTWFRGAHGFRALLRNWLNGLGPLAYLETDDIANRPQWEAERADRLVYYKAAAGDRTFFFTIGVTRDREVTRLEFAPY